MCGIAGRFHPVSLPEEPSWHVKADALLAHRGPDGHGYYVDECCELVHRRLALIDLSITGQQPMSNEDGGLYVIFNGEIYNHQDLRTGLESQGHIFRSTSDTEVLVHLYEEYGEQMVTRLRGIFVFAIYDRRQHRLFLARDRFGIKPLYYAVQNHEWIFASEIKAILALSGFNPRIDRQACYDFLGLGYIPEPATGFTDIYALPKATTLAIDMGGHRFTQFHSIAAQPSLGRTLSDTVETVSETLRQAVKRQTVADVPVAALLSGGIDSSLVVAAYTHSTGEPPTTFNVRFPDKDHDETALALAVSKHFGTRHHTIDLGEWAVTTDSILHLLDHFDQPFADTSLVPTYWISKAVRQRGFICTLSGDGGDEAFGGYARFWRANKLIQLMKLPGWLRQATKGSVNYLTGWTRDWGRQMAKAVQLAQAGQRDSSMLLAGLSNYLSEEQKQELVLPAARERLETVYRYFDGYHPPGVSDLEELSLRMTENLFSVGLPSDMLRKVDMMSMLASIEVRVPMLDEEVVALGLTLPHRTKTDGGTGKIVLRALAKQWLPKEVAAHPKHGFSIPLDVMLPFHFHQVAEDLLVSVNSRIRAFVNMRLVQQWLSVFRKARQGNRVGTISRAGVYQRVFNLLALELWLRKHKLSW